MATKLPAKKTTDELQVDCEVAAEIIAEYFAYCANQLADEKRNPEPNLDKINTLETKLRELHQEKMALGVDNAEVINRALYLYAPLLKNAV